MEPDIHKELIFSHFDKKTSPLQREQIARWLKEKANEEQYYEWLDEWENKHLQYVAHLDPASQRYQRFLADHPNEEVLAPIPSVWSESRPLWQSSWFVAACVLLLCGLGLFLRSDVFRYVTHETAYGETRSLQLIDGSAVQLGPNSSLRVPRWGFGDHRREVQLTGEADFSVTHTASHQPFVVKANKQLDILVVGTEFTVFARKRGARVALRKGEVQLQYRENAVDKKLTMKPGQLATLDPANHVAVKETSRPVAPVASDEQSHRFVFDEISVQEVAYMLEEKYGLQVVINDRELASRVLAGSLRADNVDQLLQSIAEILDVSVVRQGKQVRLQRH